ncbi:SIR2 family NAD-dependent protein deacylase [Tsukamurella paurometabola]|uniref:NAD-dependent protein deacylase n=1 Tax=Tsukamurella paurometabola (strain ATCC 8368 / DSM 20162 / CCUG 35730 / CIP 100753 / JCM 10117 / KCTC 9821 / NBRC 16120 / NCIMB 702349 / NCTC 13040) TaxID=521096 RepID=D5UWS1_TSUPD|nr:NAD-dependent deacylase [Tsukamurella paurometabola]ADG77943.1 Silent information regulator protein Sir2 [Tsukamurella paurometabola DSM 20162]SUP29463.1 NAD-dependent deacetylase [Tsukamurella paurometabola]
MQPGMRPSDRPAPVPVDPAVTELVRDAESIVVLTGAGMSAESGIATFREAQTGLWARYDPEEIASVDAWTRDSALVWGWYQWRGYIARQAEPNNGHIALAELGTRRSVSIVTQNIDDLHERAGSEVTAHLHGSLFAPRCEYCGTPYLGSDAEIRATDGEPTPEMRVTPPTCMQCLSQVRPGIVWFGEPLPMEAWGRAEAAVIAADLVLVIGTSGLVYPAARLPEMALEAGIPVVEINPEPTPLSARATVAWNTTAATGLPALVAAVTSGAAHP